MLGSKRHDEIIPYYSVADCSILPSLMEATSISGLEAMASGLPLVGTRVGGIPDLIDEGINGYLCEPSSSKSLAKAIDTLLDSDIKDMREASYHKASLFDWSKIAEKTITAYRNVL
jgi:glycosyltransferase involved in cell wall biosynthesis